MVYFVRPGRPAFPRNLTPDRFGLVALGGDLDDATLVEAYAKGIFPWSGDPPVPWYSPDPRLILRPQEVYESRSLAKEARKGAYTIRYDQHFEGVMRACARVPRRGQGGTWIGENMITAYARLARRGIAHSVEVYRGERLVGGLYGLSLGAAFFGESMFAAEPNASKLALVRLCRDLAALDFAFVDCQQDTPHLRSMGAVTVSRAEYLAMLAEALEQPTLQGSWGPDGPWRA
ncbi:MAG: leucyl/phenylalanyl-tRNA--protein transferase [Myxococcales bacterium]|nr:leucyl/phenylalanyl-tRNA--protein transferase [Myxococcales bacterium]